MRKKASNAEKVLNEQAGVQKVINVKNGQRKKYNCEMKRTNKASTSRYRRHTVAKILRSLERDSGISGIFLLHSPNWKRSSIKVKVYGPLGRRFRNKKKEAYRLVRQTFHHLVCNFERKRPPHTAKEEDIYEHLPSDDEEETPEEVEADETENCILNNAMEQMPTYEEDAEVEIAIQSGDEDTDEETTHVVNKRDLRSSPASPSSSAGDIGSPSPLPPPAVPLPATAQAIIPPKKPGSISNAISPIPSTGDRSISSASANIVILSAPSPPTASTSSAITMLAQSNARVVKGLIPVSKPPPGTRVIKIVNAGHKP